MAKKCSECGYTGADERFYACHKYRCKECHKSNVRASRAANVERYREYDRMRFKRDSHRQEANKAYAKTEAGKLSMAKARARFVAMNPEKRAAHILLGNAVRSGRVLKPSTCSKCLKETASRMLHGHHEDYARPLDVEWICTACHALEHRP